MLLNLKGITKSHLLKVIQHKTTNFISIGITKKKTVFHSKLFYFSLIIMFIYKSELITCTVKSFLEDLAMV